MVFYGEPESEDAAANLKQVADEESMQAKWFTVDQLAEMNRNKELRYDEPLFWAQYIQSGGQIMPISLIADTVPARAPDIAVHEAFKISEHGDLLKTKF